MELVPLALRKSKLSTARGLSRPEQDKTKVPYSWATPYPHFGPAYHADMTLMGGI